MAKPYLIKCQIKVLNGKQKNKEVISLLQLKTKIRSVLTKGYRGDWA